MMSIESAIAANRFGLGARPGELKKLEQDPRAYLLNQLKGPTSQPAYISQIPRSDKILTDALHVRKMQRRIKKQAGAEKPTDEKYNYASTVRSYYVDQVSARFRNAFQTEYPFHQRLVSFWSNHFAVSADKQPISALAGAYENEVIRPKLGGKFIDLLLAAEKHPAMIMYLDNERSVGPNSAVTETGKRRRVKKSADINENLAREVLELHTLGVSGGYDQADVTAFAHALTGWSVGSDQGRFKQGVPGAFVFRENIHEPGPKTIMGQTYSQQGIAQGEAILRDLAQHPSTARFIATKLVRHFVADEPPEKMVKRVAKVFLKSGGDLPQVHAALVNSKEAWKTPLSKYKTPQDFVISTFRAFDFVPDKTRLVVTALEQMGQMPYRPGSPAGWPDTSDHWGGADALYKRIEWSNSVARRAGSRVKPMELGEMILGANFGDHTRAAVSRAESATQGTTLLLASPDFQRR
jgi:uncharacterized protein (DUF1800 family)